MPAMLVYCHRHGIIREGMGLTQKHDGFSGLGLTLLINIDEGCVLTLDITGQLDLRIHATDYIEPA